MLVDGTPITHTKAPNPEPSPGQVRSYFCLSAPYSPLRKRSRVYSCPVPSINLITSCGLKLPANNEALTHYSALLGRTFSISCKGHPFLGVALELGKTSSATGHLSPAPRLPGPSAPRPNYVGQSTCSTLSMNQSMIGLSTPNHSNNLISIVRLQQRLLPSHLLSSLQARSGSTRRCTRSVRSLHRTVSPREERRLASKSLTFAESAQVIKCH